LVQTALIRRCDVLHRTNLKSTFVYQNSSLSNRKRNHLWSFVKGPVHVRCLEQHGSDLWSTEVQGHSRTRVATYPTITSFGGVASPTHGSVQGLLEGKTTLAFKWEEWSRGVWPLPHSVPAKSSPLWCAQVTEWGRPILTAEGREPNCPKTNYRVGWKWSRGPTLPVLPSKLGLRTPSPWALVFSL